MERVMDEFDGLDALETEAKALEQTLGAVTAMTDAFDAQLGPFDGLVFDGKSLSETLATVGEAMSRTVYNNAMKPVTDHFGGLLADGVNSLVSGMLPFENGAAFSQGRVTPFAKGGVVSGATNFPMRGGMGLMGEAGPEAIMPLTRGADGSLGVKAQAQPKPNCGLCQSGFGSWPAQSLRRNEAMNFHEVRFPTSLSFGALGGPERRTEVVTLSNGFEERNTPWAHSRRRFDAGMGLRSLDDVEVLVAFFEARQGQMFGFRWKDWSDFKSAVPSRASTGDDQLIGMGDEVQSEFQIVKNYSSGTATYARPITKLVAGTVAVSVSGIVQTEGVDYVVDLDSGLVTFTHPPDIQGEVTAGYEFDVPVRFDTDAILTSMATFQAGEVPDVPVVEVRV
ncbi:hypothetical protein GQR58_018320 [Nymphon striatum]|nr:hypothetical protein GQR58_018320 [Nymphon striatum]